MSRSVSNKKCISFKSVGRQMGCSLGRIQTRPLPSTCQAFNQCATTMSLTGLCLLGVPRKHIFCCRAPCGSCGGPKALNWPTGNRCKYFATVPSSSREIIVIITLSRVTAQKPTNRVTEGADVPDKFSNRA